MVRVTMKRYPRDRAIAPPLGQLDSGVVAATMLFTDDQRGPLVTTLELQRHVRARLKDRRPPFDPPLGPHLGPPLSRARCPPVCPPFTDSCRQDGNNCSTYGYDGISHQRIRNYPCQAARGATADENGGYRSENWQCGWAGVISSERKGRSVPGFAGPSPAWRTSSASLARCSYRQSASCRVSHAAAIPLRARERLRRHLRSRSSSSIAWWTPSICRARARSSPPSSTPPDHRLFLRRSRGASPTRLSRQYRAPAS